MLHHHRITASDGIELALHRVRGDAGRGGRMPLLLVSGTFNGRSFWLGTEEQGVAWHLARGGFDPWILEPRGHGSSARPRSWLLSDWVERDAPAAVEAVAKATGWDRVTWVGHSAGGVVGAAFAGTLHPAAAALGRLVLLGTPGPEAVRGRRRWLARLFFWAAAARRNGLLPGRALKLGPEPESGALVQQWLGWNLSGSWRSPAGADYLARLRDVHLPVLAVAGSDDPLLAPIPAVRDLLNRFGSARRTLLVAGRQHGMSRDYTHGSLVLARSAREEVWPRITAWLLEQEAERPPRTITAGNT